APRREVALRGTGEATATAPVQRPLEIWPWVLLGSLVLLTLEWWLFNRPVWRMGRGSRKA
ncbi:MAG TPA: hypothetical protein VM409_02235, partial [Chloroflexia bacterium]|nr:hypothetical protein [Chloroflexia bacterium]